MNMQSANKQMEQVGGEQADMHAKLDKLLKQMKELRLYWEKF